MGLSGDTCERTDVYRGGLDDCGSPMCLDTPER